MYTAPVPPARPGAPTKSVPPSGVTARALPKLSPATLSAPVSGCALAGAHAAPQDAEEKTKTPRAPGAPTKSCVLFGETANAAPKRLPAAHAGQVMLAANGVDDVHETSPEAHTAGWLAANAQTDASTSTHKMPK
jgi:hypothetical protein